MATKTFQHLQEIGRLRATRAELLARNKVLEDLLRKIRVTLTITSKDLPAVDAALKDINHG